MRRLAETGWRMLALLVVAAAGGCGSDNSGPAQSPPVIAKTATKNGDAQTGPVSQPLPNALQVLVTRDGAPAPNVTVTWSAGSGSVSPTTQPTDPNGVSGSVWTLGDTPGTQTATASVSGATGSPVTFTATATTGGPIGEVILVRSPDANGSNRFDPAELTVVVGTTVTWQWAEGATGHNVVPDDGATPASSGALASAPHTYQFTFDTPGVYQYHCQAHGAAGGVGMSGTVTVVAEQ